MTEANELRDEGMARTSRANADWKEYGLLVIEELPLGWHGTGEAIREAVAQEPNHPNAWGALAAAALKKGLIRPTGVHVPMIAKKSHGRKTPVYERVAA